MLTVKVEEKTGCHSYFEASEVNVQENDTSATTIRTPQVWFTKPNGQVESLTDFHMVFVMNRDGSTVGKIPGPIPGLPSIDP